MWQSRAGTRVSYLDPWSESKEMAVCTGSHIVPTWDLSFSCLYVFLFNTAFDTIEEGRCAIHPDFLYFQMEDCCIVGCFHRALKSLPVKYLEAN